MGWLTNPTNSAEKFLLMFVAIILFVLIMALILFIADRPKKAPSWVIALAFAGIPMFFLSGV